MRASPRRVAAFVERVTGRAGLGAHLRPVLVTSYRRTTVVAGDGSFRLTIDGTLRCEDAADATRCCRATSSSRRSRRGPPPRSIGGCGGTGAGRPRSASSAPAWGRCTRSCRPTSGTG
ncbi:MAG: VTC domain-containing protein [Acidimicrobiales bacterium]